jgi:uncharacterized protein (TIGR03086 family)
VLRDRQLVPILGDALARTGAIVEEIGPGGYRRPSVCAGWTVGDVLAHLIGTIDKFSRYVRGDTTAPRTNSPAPKQICHTGYVAVANEAVDAWQSVTHRPPCTLPFGTYECWTALGIVIFDVVLHGHDLALSSGQPYDVDTETGCITYNMATLLVTPAAIEAGQYSRVADEPDPTARDFGAALRLTGRSER